MFNVALVIENAAKEVFGNSVKVKMRDYTSNNYCDFLWVNDLLQIKRDSNNLFVVEVKRDQKSSKIAVGNITIFGMVVEVKQVGCKDFLYQLDDGTGVIACKHSERHFEEVMDLIENEHVDILNQLSETQQSFEQNSIVDYSVDNSVFNDRSLQIEEGLLTIWDDVYKSFNSLIEPYNIGDFVIIQGKLYTYLNMNQIYINKIRVVDLMEEIMLVSVKLEDSFQLSKETGNTKIQLDSEKRLSGLVTFDNIPHLSAKISIPRNIRTPDALNYDALNSTSEIVTPNLEPSITFDTLTNSD